MSRTREKNKNNIYYLFPIRTEEVDGQIENKWAEVGIRFGATKVGERIKETIDPLSGKVIITTTIETLKSQSQYEFNVGDRVSKIPKPTNQEFSTIVASKSKLQNQRGGKVNNVEIKDWTIDIS